MKKFFFSTIIIIVLSSCAPSATLKELYIGDTRVTYATQSCQRVKWDGMKVSIEGINVPNKGNLAFSVGKIDYSDKAIREIQSTIFYYDGLLEGTCQTLVRLREQDAIERYSKHRDFLLSSLASTLTELERASTENLAEEIAKKGKVKAESAESSFNKTDQEPK